MWERTLTLNVLPYPSTYTRHGRRDEGVYRSVPWGAYHRLRKETPALESSSSLHWEIVSSSAAEGQDASRAEGHAMTFDEILEQAIEMLRRRGRLTYRALKRQFALDDEYLDDLKEELIYGQRLARDEDDRVLVWIGETESALPPT